MPQYQRLQMSDSLARAFLGVAEEVLRQGKRKLDKDELVLRPYDAGSKPDSHEVEYIHVSDQSHIKDQLVPLRSLVELGEFKQDANFVEGLRYYVIAIQLEESSPIYFFRSYSARQEITRSRWDISAVMQENNYFNRITAPIFLFDKEIDCIVRDEHLFTFDQGNFHKLFQFFEYARQVGDETLRAIQRVVPIINFESFANSCRNHPLKLSKLRTISQKPYFTNGQLTMDKLIEVVDKYALNIMIVAGEDGRKMFVYDSKRQWELLTLLDDGYLESVMTGNSYEVSGKRQYERK